MFEEGGLVEDGLSGYNVPMPGVAEAPVKASSSKILRELEALSFDALDKLMPKIEALRLKKHPQVLSSRETWLMNKVQSGPPARLVAEHRTLMERRDAGCLSAADRRRLPALVAQWDAHQAQHVQWLVELAALRKTTVPSLTRQLGLPKR